MAIDYDPDQASSAFPAGEYDAVLASVEEKTSKAGNEMEVWTFDVFNNDTGKKIKLKEYVTAAAAFKIDSLARALGKGELFKARKFQAEDFIDSSLRVKLKVESSNEYGDQNKIEKYLPPKTSARPTSMKPSLRKSDNTDSPIDQGQTIDPSSIPF